jgi:son of sevenless-like protein
LKSRPKRSEKLKKFYGTDVPTHYLQQLNPEATPWYLRPDYNDADINLDPADGSVKAGTVAALIERLTAHDNPGKNLNVRCQTSKD